MIMNFRRGNPSRSRRRFLIVLVSVVAVLLVLRWGWVSNFAVGISHAAAFPVWKFVDMVRSTTETVINYFSSKEHLERENRLLREALYRRASEDYQRDLLVRENIELKTALHRATSSRRALMLAAVLARPPTSAYDTLLIDLGADDGIFVGMDVLADGMFTIGKITMVYKRSSLVTLYSSPGSQIDAYIGETSVPVTFEGIGGGAFRARVPKGLNIRPGDAAILPALSLESIGTVSGVDLSEGSSFAFVHLAFPVNVFSSRYLYVALDKSP